MEEPTKPEEWRPVEGFAGYIVSSHGRIARVLGAKPHPFGYYVHQLRRNKVAVRIAAHRIVAAAFIGPRPEGFVVNHKNGKKADNRPENLEYVTPRENSIHASRLGLLVGNRLVRGEMNPKAKMTDEKVREARRLLGTGASQRAIARQMGVTERIIWGIKHGTCWKHVA